MVNTIRSPSPICCNAGIWLHKLENTKGNCCTFAEGQNTQLYLFYSAIEGSVTHNIYKGIVKTHGWQKAEMSLRC
jgi:hypothetical protein